MEGLGLLPGYCIHDNRWWKMVTLVPLGLSKTWKDSSMTSIHRLDPNGTEPVRQRKYGVKNVLGHTIWDVSPHSISTCLQPCYSRQTFSDPIGEADRGRLYPGHRTVRVFVLSDPIKTL